jgi:uncharacterized protein YqjF (DUF2071 family)
VGVVAFTMQNVKPWSWLPKLPTASEFFEINCRTYVHLDGTEPGIVFYSLDATSSLAVLGARLFWGLPYYRASMTFGGSRWTAERRWPSGAPMSGFRAAYETGEALPESRDGTLEFFLAERYQFYRRTRSGGLQRARVHHPPYPLQAVTQSEVTPSFLQPLGLQPGARTPDYFSPGVDVEVFSLEDVP